ncbi:sigma-70 family RNA polymerase sigma factor [Streptomyces sp. AC495_CC817]|uniref:sigma-70 family RNA polymerase sigma factor n=1 Tax=Streptomyces sp. AC495_CC817 TaxID=2823900 RepID=UPI001C269665|nr:sigma-70 family RNA polymerase sigma factor [Streptomyces sp. AC495_CC817]
MEDPRSDAELIRELRDGDRLAYVALWERHVGAALRYAHRLQPSRAEDLVSEAFLAIYQQVTTTPKGPQFAFRSYLKAVIRNISIRWRADDTRIDDTAEADRVDMRDALSLVARESDAGELLDAFLELPERWQRVLWLAEVADTPRPEIARQLGLSPNAVSALQRRARSGLKLQWLTRQVPVALRDDSAHAARLFPEHLAGSSDPVVAAEVASHVATCSPCGELLLTMHSDARRLQGVTLSAVGFGALGAIVPAGAALTPAGTAAAAAVTLLSGAGLGGLLLSGAGVLSVGGLLLASLLVPPPASSEADAAPPIAVVRPEAGESLPVPTVPVTVPSPGPGEPPPLRTGRRVDDPRIGDVDLVLGPGDDYPVAPTRPQPGTDVPDPGGDPGTGLAPGMTTPAQSSGYLAPRIAGTSAPGSTIAVEVDGQRYTAPVADDGSWSFDPRGLELAAGTYDYRVWAYDATRQSEPVSGAFTITPIEVQGFEGLTGFEDMHIDEARTTGLVVALTGPANGRIFVSSMQGHTAMIPLDATGHAIKRLRMASYGWYYLTFRALDAEENSGPAVEDVVDVYDPTVVFDPWGPGDEAMTFEFVDP